MVAGDDVVDDVDEAALAGDDDVEDAEGAVARTLPRKLHLRVVDRSY